MCLFPARCFTCGKVISIYFDDLEKHYENDPEFMVSIDDMLDKNKLYRACCRRMFLSFPFHLHETFLKMAQKKKLVTTANFDLSKYVTQAAVKE